MNAKDQLKLQKAGYVIIRADWQALTIKAKDKSHLHWYVLHKGFASKAALQRKMNDLLTISTIIED